MSSVDSTTSPSSNFEALFNTALEECIKQKGIDLAEHPLAAKIDACGTVADVLDVFQEQAQAFDEFRTGDPRLIKCLQPVVGGLNSLCSNSTLSLVASTVFPPAKVIFSSVGFLLSVAKDVKASYDVLVDLFQRIESFLGRLKVYTEVPQTPMMTEIAVKILVEVLSVLALATKQIREGKIEKYVKKLFGDKEIEAVLQRLTKLTEEETRRTATQTLALVYNLVNNMTIVMQDGKTSMEVFQKALVTIQDIVSEINQSKFGQLQKDFQQWLSAPDPSTNHNIARKAHHNGTATWFIRGDTFGKWKTSQRGDFLWIHGNPGSGKSVLCSSIIEEIKGIRKAGLGALGYFYLDFRDRNMQDARSLLCSLLIQFCIQSDGFCNILSGLYKTHGNGFSKPNEEELRQCLEDMLGLQDQGAIYVIVDGLDECPSSGLTPPRAEALDIVQKLVKLRLPHVHFCVTSRPEIDIRSVLKPLMDYDVCLHDENGQKEDIINYINSEVGSNQKMRRWREGDKKLVIDTLTKQAGGMFRWVHCQLDALSDCLPASIGQALKELPAGLDETYQRTLEGIANKQQQYAYHLFQCLTVSMRPLRAKELAEIFAFEFRPEGEENPTFDARWRPEPEDAEETLLSTCSTLITIVNVDGDHIVQFSHLSVKEFLTSDRLKAISGYHIQLKPAHTFLARTCLSILLRLDHHDDEARIGDSPLASYAAEHWVDHAQFGDVSSLIRHDMESLFGRIPHFTTWIWIYDIDSPSSSRSSRIQREKVPLYYAALCGFRDTAEYLITHGQDVNTRGGRRATPLHAAVDTGHMNVAELLLEHRADANARDDADQTPLHIASKRGDAEAVRLLIGKGADPNMEDDQEETPLSLALANGGLEAARVLLQHGADAHHRDMSGKTLLHVASQNGNRSAVQLLLENGANPRAGVEDRETPLHLASAHGKLDLVRMLLERDASIDARDHRGRTPLHSASLRGHLEVMQLLLDGGADVNAQKADGATALHLAASSGHLQVVEWLLRSDADPRTRNNEGETSHKVASRKNHPEIARLLDIGS